MLKERLRESGRSLRKRASEGGREGRLGGFRMSKLMVVNHRGNCVCLRITQQPGMGVGRGTSGFMLGWGFAGQVMKRMGLD